MRLIKRELVPLSRRPRLRGARLRKEVAARLKRGLTLVGSRTPDSEPVAFVHMEIRPPTLFVDLLAVDAKAQHRGWGTQLMAAAEKIGREQHCFDVRLFVDNTNESGFHFYRKLGYRVARHIPEAQCREMVKPLTTATWA